MISEQINEIAQHVMIGIGAQSPCASRKFEVALQQVQRVDSVEECQQIGIVVRDAWIEFSQSVFVPQGTTVQHSHTDVKRLIEAILERESIHYASLMDMVKGAFDLCNKLEHDVNATEAMAIQCLLASGLSMILVLETLSKGNLLVQRPYYKCPNCGSIDLKTKDEWVPDFESAFRINKLICHRCGWYFIEEMGGLSGIE